MIQQKKSVWKNIIESQNKKKLFIIIFFFSYFSGGYFFRFFCFLFQIFFCDIRNKKCFFVRFEVAEMIQKKNIKNYTEEFLYIHLLIFLIPIW